MSECVTFNPKRGLVPKKRYERASALLDAESCTADIGVPFSAYRCRDCGYWHVGKTPGRRRTPHRDEARLLEVGPRAVKAEADENDCGSDRAVRVIKGRFHRAAALAAGKSDHNQSRRRKTDTQRAIGQLREIGYYEWSGQP